eukprot:scaffold92362_cov29-Prasinocladus_malaysianus.AAC.1
MSDKQLASFSSLLTSIEANTCRGILNSDNMYGCEFSCRSEFNFLVRGFLVLGVPSGHQVHAAMI